MGPPRLTPEVKIPQYCKERLAYKTCDKYPKSVAQFISQLRGFRMQHYMKKAYSHKKKNIYKKLSTDQDRPGDDMSEQDSREGRLVRQQAIQRVRRDLTEGRVGGGKHGEGAG